MATVLRRAGTIEDTVGAKVTFRMQANFPYLISAWLNRDESYLTPESGLGYWLGIRGASLMLLLLI